tara:strand:- start:514 stop:801 length:288 start_codon:yes stop_codon:yes gene_type:complete
MKTTDRILYARQCDITGEGMNEGYCIQDGHIYIKYVEDMIKHLRELDVELSLRTPLDEELLNVYYDDDYYYWTEWECESDLQYEEVNGKLIELND